MARYIEKEPLCAWLENMGVSDFIIRKIESEANFPTADVVPKSEVEKEIKNWQELYADTVCKWEKAYEELEIKLENTKAEVAREIFEEIESYTDELLQDAVRCCDEYKSPAAKLFVALCEGKIQAFGDMKRVFAELKKKYQEGE